MNINNQKTMLAIVAGIADPVLKKWAQRLANLIPEQSNLRTEAFESVIGAFKGFIETKAEKLSPIAGVAIEKATDFSDFLSGALEPRTKFDLEKWASEILNESGPRLKESQDPVVELKRIKLELELRKQLVEIIKQELPPTPPPAVDWQKIDKQVAVTLAGINQTLEVWLPKIKKWAEESPPKEKGVQHV